MQCTLAEIIVSQFKSTHQIQILTKLEHECQHNPPVHLPRFMFLEISQQDSSIQGFSEEPLRSATRQTLPQLCVLLHHGFAACSQRRGHEALSQDNKRQSHRARASCSDQGEIMRTQ